jgi:hypothetical protein
LAVIVDSEKSKQKLKLPSTAAMEKLKNQITVRKYKRNMRRKENQER